MAEREKRPTRRPPSSDPSEYQRPKAVMGIGFSRHFKRLTDEGRALVEELKADPELLEMRYTVALQVWIAGKLVEEPDQEILEKIVEARKVAGKPEVTIEEVRRELLADAARAVVRLQKAQESTLKQIRLGEMLLDVVLPAMVALGQDFRRLLLYHVTDPSARAAFEADFDKTILAAIGKLQEASEK